MLNTDQRATTFWITNTNNIIRFLNRIVLSDEGYKNEIFQKMKTYISIMSFNRSDITMQLEGQISGFGLIHHQIITTENAIGLSKKVKQECV